MANQLVDTENQIREKLEASGQLCKMRAMIVEAAIQTLHNAPTGVQGKFIPSDALTEATSSAEGQKAFAIVYEYLKSLGLQYTSNVFLIEAGLSANTLPAADITLVELLRGAAPPGTAGIPQLHEVSPAAAKKPVSPEVSVDKTSDDIEEEDHSEKVDSEVEDGEVVANAAEGEDTTYYISKWKNKTFMRSQQVAGQQLQVEYLNDCSVTVLDPLDSMTVDDCEGGELIIAACEGSVFLRNCKNMAVHVACKQLRTRDCANITLHIFTTTDPVIEKSHHMTFVPFHLRLPFLKKSFAEARLNPLQNRFVHVYDFTPDDTSVPQPHFTVLYPNHHETMEDRDADRGIPECPPEIEDLLVGKLLPAASSESGQNKSYDIKAGAKVWAASTAETAGGDEDDSSSAEEDTQEAEVKAVPLAVPHANPGRPPVAKAPAPAKTNDDEYSSFDDDDSGSVDKDDKYEVEEDDDDF